MPKREIVRQTTFLGARAEYKEIREAGASGRREIRIRWIDKAVGQPVEWEPGTITSRTITGNFQRGTGQILVPEHIVTEF